MDNSNCPNVGNSNSNSTSSRHTYSHTQSHSPAYLYGFGLGENAVLRGYYDVMNDCSNRPYLASNVTGAIKNFTSIQQVNDCDSGYNHGWNKYCMGLAKHHNAAASCPITS
jgi:hypothetical protein